MDEHYTNLTFDELENMVRFSGEMDPPTLDIPETPQQQVEHKDFKKETNIAVEHARKYVFKLCSRFFNKDMFEKDPYLNKKVATDIENLANCIFQLRSNNFVINRILQEIDSGSTDARTIKSYTELQKQNMEVMKYNKQYQQIIENEYNQYAANWEAKNNNLPNNVMFEEDDEEEFIIVKGGEDMVNQLFAIGEDIEEAVIEEVHEEPKFEGEEDEDV